VGARALDDVESDAVSMTVTVERTFSFAADPTAVWDFISDPGNRAAAISVVDRYEPNHRDSETSDGTGGTGDRGTWHVTLPIPLLDKTVTVETRDVERRDGEYVKFVGRSRVFRVVGEHEITDSESGCELRNRFRVEGKLPGVETYFERNLDGELDNLERALREDLGLPA
jgi:carbon monoxide dehydrogenase subunit G